MHTPLRSEAVRHRTARDDDGCPENQGYCACHSRAERCNRRLIPFGHVLVRCCFKTQSIYARQNEKREFDPEMNASISRNRFSPEEQRPGYEHQGKPDECNRHYLLPHFRYRLITQCKPKQPKIEPTEHAD